VVRCLLLWKATVETFKCDSSRLTKTVLSALPALIALEMESALAAVAGTVDVLKVNMTVAGLAPPMEWHAQLVHQPPNSIRRNMQSKFGAKGRCSKRSSTTTAF